MGTFGSALLLVAQLLLSERAQVGALAVQRTSLLGYEINGQVWEAAEAALVLGHAAALAEAAPALHGDLLRSVVRDGVTFETWLDGAPARRREAALRRALGSSVRRDTTRASGFGDDTVDKVTLRYVSRGPVPAIERAS